jgi:hypothetical protein
MTLGWAIIIAVVLYLLDKHNLLKKTLKVVGIGAVIIASVLVIVIAAAYEWDMLTDGWSKWKEHQLAVKSECFDPSSGKVHAVNEGTPWCGPEEVVHLRGEPAVAPFRVFCG